MLISCFSRDFYRIRITSDLSRTHTHTHTYNTYTKETFSAYFIWHSFPHPFSFSLTCTLPRCRFLFTNLRLGYLYANSFNSIRFNICLLSKQSIKLFDSTSRLSCSYSPFRQHEKKIYKKLRIWLRDGKKYFFLSCFLVVFSVLFSRCCSCWKF